MSITNTAKHEKHPEWTMGGNPEAIVDQEVRGQRELVMSSELPRTVITESFEDEDAKKLYEELGFRVEEKEDDKLFYKVKMPSGYKVEGAEHPMWSELIYQGEVIAQIFYKAAFYDRRAHICFITKN